MRTKPDPPHSPTSRRRLHERDDYRSSPRHSDESNDEEDINDEPPNISRSPNLKHRVTREHEDPAGISQNYKSGLSPHLDRRQFPPYSYNDSGLKQDGVSPEQLPYYVLESFSVPKQKARKDPDRMGLFICCAALLFFVSVYFVFFYSTSTSDVVEHKTDAVDKLKMDLVNVKQQFPSQMRDLWFSFMSGIKKIVAEEPNAPSTFLLLYHDKSSTSDCLAKKVGEAAAKFLTSEGKEPIIVDGFRLKHNDSLLEDYGRFTSAYKPRVENSGVMIINNLQEIPGTIAQTFHTFCDEINPLVEKAVYFFTLKVSNWSEERPTKLAEKTLTSIWGELDVDIIQPLITRMTSEVFVIRPEEGTPCGQ